MDVLIKCYTYTEDSLTAYVYIEGSYQPDLSVEEGSESELEETFEYLTEEYGDEIVIDQIQ